MTQTQTQKVSIQLIWQTPWETDFDKKAKFILLSTFRLKVAAYNRILHPHICTRLLGIII